MRNFDPDNGRLSSRNMPYHLALFLAATAVSQGQGITNAFLTNSTVSYCDETPPTSSTFSPSDSKVALFFKFDSVPFGTLSAIWLGPGGVPISSGNWNLGQSYCFIDNLPMAGTANAAKLGDWKVQVFLNGVMVVNLPFRLTAAGPTAPWSRFTLSGNSQFNVESPVYDLKTNRILTLASVSDGVCCLSGNQLWLLNNANGMGGTPSWTRLTAVGTPPAIRAGHSAVYDQANNRLIIFGGGYPNSGIFNPRYNDVWVLANANGNSGTPTWILLTPNGSAPAPREGHRAVYDPASNRMIVFGGGNNGIMDIPNDVWILSNANGLGGTPQWIQAVPSSANGPARRQGHGVGFDPVSSRLFVFGGCCYQLGDLWILQHANGLGGTPAWQQLSQGPNPSGARSDFLYAYDQPSNRFLVFGGLDSTRRTVNDVWVLNNPNGVGNSAWANVYPNDSPGAPPRAVTGGTYDPVNKRVLYLEGNTNLWVLDASASLGGAPGANPPVLSISKTHAGTPVQGQIALTYTINVNNAPAAGATTGTVTVTEQVPSGLSLTSMSGSGWTCAGTSCTRADSLAGGASYPPITAIFSVAPNAPQTVTNQATLSGSGFATVLTSDLTPIGPQTGSGSLRITIKGIPDSTTGSVVIQSPNGFSRIISASQTVPVPAGTYDLRPNPLPLADVTYFAQPATAVSVNPGSLVDVVINYSTVVPSSTKVLDLEGVQGLSVLPDGTLMLPATSASAQALAVGHILTVGITPATPHGLLRQVASITPSGSQLIVATNPAVLADAFQQLDFAFNAPLDPVKLKPMGKLPAGVTVRTKDRTQPSQANSQAGCASDSVLLVETVNATILQDDNGTITSTGELDICPSLQLKVNFSTAPPQVNSLSATASIGGTFHFGISGTYHNSFSKQVTIVPLQSEPILVDVFGIPLVLTAQVNVFVGASGQADGSFSAGFSQSTTLTGGVSYEAGQTTPVGMITSDFTADPVALDATISARATAGLTLGLSIDDFITPRVTLDGFLQLNVDPLLNPWWTLTGGMELTGGVDVTILGVGQNFDIPLFSREYPIAKASGGILPGDKLPKISTLAPAQAVAGAADLTLLVTGVNFAPGATVSFAGTPLNSTGLSATQMRVLVPAALLSTAGTFPVVATNLFPWNDSSAAVPFQVTAPVLNPQPVISNLSPSSAVAGSSSLVLTISGSAFVEASTVTFNGVAHAPTLVSANQITIVLTASDLSSAGSFAVVVNNPAPGGGRSNSLSFLVTMPIALSALTLNPASVVGGNNVTGTLTLSAPAATAVSVALSSSLSSVSPPATVTVPVGKSSVDFTITTAAISAAQTAMVLAKLGNSSVSASLSILPAPPSFSGKSFSVNGTMLLSGQTIGIVIHALTANGRNYTTALEQISNLYPVNIIIGYNGVTPTVGANGNTITFSGPVLAGLYSNGATFVNITSATLTVTANTVANGSGVTGSLSFTGPGGTITGTISGTLSELF